ncbi:tyrosine-type recombinase/integrase [Endozoicomonas atrinae]|uniref:tyrosine-type recombinase/integrase n=1 Tax=Endozoicomonas atrinae TaxID=1333660 RepID=UPI003AFF8194
MDGSKALTPKDITDFIKKRLVDVSSATVRKDVLFLSRFYNFAIRDLHLQVQNPTQQVRIPSCSQPRDRVATDGELSKILDNVSPNMKDVFEFALETAMRRGELALLDWKYVHLRERIVRLPKEITKANRDRDVPLSSKAVEILHNRGPLTHGSVFNVTINGISSAMRRACIKTGVKNYRTHDMRHQAISHYAKKGECKSNCASASVNIIG